MDVATNRAGFPPLSRRALITAAPVLVVFPPLGSSATQIQRLFHQWEAILVQHDEDYRAAEAQARASATWVDLEWEEKILALTEPEHHRIEDAIQAEPTTDLRDLAIKVLVGSGEGNWAISDALTLEYKALAGRDVDKLPGCLFEGQACLKKMAMSHLRH